MSSWLLAFRSSPWSSVSLGAPPAAVAALRTALVRLGNDKAYAEDALKTMGYVPEYEAGTDTSEKVRAALTVGPEVRTFVADYIKAGN